MAEDQAGDPAQAFEDLRAEVSVLRRAIEGLPAAIREKRPPDYSQDLAILGKGLDEIGQSLETVLASPALNLTPEQQGQGIARAGSALVRAFSMVRILSLVSTPPSAEKPPVLPPAASTRWQGTMIGQGFWPSATPTARAAPATPAPDAPAPPVRR